MVWNNDMIHDLKDFWAEGLSTAEIGRRLSVSKNAVVGKAHRLELEPRPSPIRRDGPKPEPEDPFVCVRLAGPTLPPLASADVYPMTPPAANIQPFRLAPVPAAMTATPASIPPPAARAVMPPAPVRPRRPAPSCCWPIGEPGTKTFRFCDDTSLPGKPYCDEHAKLAYVRIRDRKEDAA